ncbi:MAG: SIMPL domain-containing protein [Verrucomicrobiales bacterium]|nr:SIMPL domain-containing protein [Verrucomicrobiales bacterium]
MSLSSEAPEPRKFLNFRVVAVLCFSLCMVWATAIAANTWHRVRTQPDRQIMRVTGSATKRIQSDLIEWTADLKSQDADRTAAYRKLSEFTVKAVAFLKSQGIKAEEIKPQSSMISEDYETVEETEVLPNTNTPLRRNKRVLKGHTASQSILVTSSDVALVEKASREITSLLEQGVDVNSQAPRYHYTKLGELKVEMLAAAAADARSRAEQILTAAGKTKPGRLLSADMGIININPANSTATSVEGNNDKSSFEKDIITVIRAQFEVN